MHWWQSAFSSSATSSSPSSARAHSDDTLIVARGGKYVLKGPFLFGRSRSRRIDRGSRRHHVTGGDHDIFRHSCCEYSPAGTCNIGAQPSTLPLPLPESQSPARQDTHSASSIPLPSPKELHFSPKDRDFKGYKTDSNHSVNLAHAQRALSLHRYLSEAAKKTKTENVESGLQGRKSKHKLNETKKFTNLKIPPPISAPTSPFASPVHSPLNGCLGEHWSPKFITPQNSIFQVWSAPEMSRSTAHDLNALISPISSMRSPTRPTSPLPSVIPNETTMARRDSINNSNSNSSQTNVHPLPLPPSAVVAASASQPEFSPSVPLTPKSELLPVKGHWQKGKLIGRGTFGIVHVASNRETGALCAMKEVEILPDDPKSAECIKQLQQEIKVLSNLKHPNIVQYFGSEIVGDRFYIYLEYVHPGSINKFIHDHCGAITESVVRNFTRHILCGLAYLHGTRTIHRDIKGANLLVDAYGVVKLADFGMSKHLSGQAGHLSFKGSPYWMAPELLQQGIQDSKSDHALAVDIWSLGCTIIEMMNGKPPWSEYEGPAAMFKVLKESPPIPESLSVEGKDFLQHCFRRNPAERPTASMLLEHPFVRKNLHQPCLPHAVRPT
ncbi:unnamed protein product [Cuscuta epithymum]|uniref:mitogen-activated protein kinase kinase kinase n=1 Tax=Cuscuta epithymum TaxID=186058 RepID=A0AAV0EP74_9ASTE|nr:unnamed protein product [Cuscuta epithymum]